MIANGRVAKALGIGVEREPVKGAWGRRRRNESHAHDVALAPLVQGVHARAQPASVSRRIHPMRIGIHLAEIVTLGGDAPRHALTKGSQRHLRNQQRGPQAHEDGRGLEQHDGAKPKDQRWALSPVARAEGQPAKHQKPQQPRVRHQRQVPDDPRVYPRQRSIAHQLDHTGAGGIRTRDRHRTVDGTVREHATGGACPPLNRIDGARLRAKTDVQGRVLPNLGHERHTVCRPGDDHGDDVIAFDAKLLGCHRTARAGPLVEKQAEGGHIRPVRRD